MRWDAHTCVTWIVLEWYYVTIRNQWYTFIPTIISISLHFTLRYQLQPARPSVFRGKGCAVEYLNICHVFLLFICCLSSFIPVLVELQVANGWHDRDFKLNLKESWFEVKCINHSRNLLYLCPSSFSECQARHLRSISFSVSFVQLNFIKFFYRFFCA